MNFTSVITAILAAIMALAVIIPGLDALKASLVSLRDSKKGEAVERCYAIVARQKVPGNQVESEQGLCIEKANDEIDANFATAIDMIDKFRAALVLQEQSAASAAMAASAASGSSGTP